MICNQFFCAQRHKAILKLLFLSAFRWLSFVGVLQTLPNIPFLQTRKKQINKWSYCLINWPFKTKVCLFVRILDTCSITTAAQTSAAWLFHKLTSSLNHFWALPLALYTQVFLQLRELAFNFYYNILFQHLFSFCYNEGHIKTIWKTFSPCLHHLFLFKCLFYYLTIVSGFQLQIDFHILRLLVLKYKNLFEGLLRNQ